MTRLHTSHSLVSDMSLRGLLLAVFLVLLAALELPAAPNQPHNKIIPIEYPLFKQCNSTWGNQVLSKQTICEVGCLLTSISMALNHFKIPVAGQEADPGTVNQWLRKNQGYLKNDELIESKLENLSSIVKFVGAKKGSDSIPKLLLMAYLERSVVVIADIRNGTHFVLMTGWDTFSGNWTVNDPGFSQTEYSSTDIVGYRVFTMT